MNGAEILSCTILALGVLALAFQYGVAVGQKRREQRIERQRGEEAKTLLDWVNSAWRQQR